MKDLRWNLFWKLTLWRDKSPEPITTVLDWIRYEVLRDLDDERYWYD